MALERQVRAKLASKRDADQEREAQEWIESILGQQFPAVPYDDALHDGIILCEVMNKLKPGAVPKINRSGGQFKMMENITNFLKAIEAYGVPKIDLFQTVDLYEKKDIATVTSSLFALGRTTYLTGWAGPYLGPRPSSENKREFSDEVIQAGKTVIGLQAGSNQGASQAGQNMGAGRKIILGK